jgi:hypothetical protein
MRAEDMHALLCICIMHGRKHLYPFTGHIYKVLSVHVQRQDRASQCTPGRGMIMITLQFAL